MTDIFAYTKEFSVSSSLIDSAWYNENDETLVLDVDDELYRYSGVPGEAVSALVRGGDTGSVGAHYNRVFKKAFGPGEHLGFWDTVEPVWVHVIKNTPTPTTPKGLVDISFNDVVDAVDNYLDSQAPTKEFSLNSEPTVVKFDPPLVVDVSEPTREFALSFDEGAPSVAEVEGLDNVKAIVVHFTLSGDKVYKYKARTSHNVEDAIEELNDYVSLVGAKGRVRKVVVKFD